MEAIRNWNSKIGEVRFYPNQGIWEKPPRLRRNLAPGMENFSTENPLRGAFKRGKNGLKIPGPFGNPHL